MLSYTAINPVRLLDTRNNIGGVMAAGLRPLVQAANLAVGAVSGLPKPVKDTGAALIALGIASTGAAISIAALNLVLAQTGGLAGLASWLRRASLHFGLFNVHRPSQKMRANEMVHALPPPSCHLPVFQLPTASCQPS